MVWYKPALKMTEVPKPQPRKQETGPTPELPLREVYKLGSQAILDGIYARRIGNPEALRAYFIRQRTEFLQQHPDGEATLDKPGPIGRWHGLVHSDTVEEYTGLASFAESEVHRRNAGLTEDQTNNPGTPSGRCQLPPNSRYLAPACYTYYGGRAGKTTAFSRLGHDTKNDTGCP